jgi:hypothetical protein
VLVGDARERIQACAAPSRENHSLHPSVSSRPAWSRGPSNAWCTEEPCALA